MSQASAKFQDLGRRVASALVLLLLAGFAIWSGGIVLKLFVGLLAGAAAWELARMCGSPQPLVVGGLTFAAVISASLVTWEMRAPFILAAVGVSYGLVNENKKLFVVSHVLIAAGALAFLLVATTKGLNWLLWMIGVVVLTDIAGYFAGKLFGGPKFWPSLSPNKTWSGTAAGWVAAAIFGALMLGPLNAAASLILVSGLMSFASQLGDIFQSMMKRRSGIKDSSNLIPGHGGVWDRFDGLLAAALVFWLLFRVF